MGLRYDDLDHAIRELMLDEIEWDLAGRGGQHGLYLSNYLTYDGQQRWPELLKRAAENGDDDTLAASLAGCFKDLVPRRTKNGTTMVRVPHTAAQTLAEAQFNMYYIRALCRRALEIGGHVEVYRAKAVDVPRATSEQLIGRSLDPSYVLHALRDTLGVDPPTDVPLPNTGITVKLRAR